LKTGAVDRQGNPYKPRIPPKRPHPNAMGLRLVHPPDEILKGDRKVHKMSKFVKNGPVPPGDVPSNRHPALVC
jgi:hypothetical protein